jgi:hypothetical protein
MKDFIQCQEALDLNKLGFEEPCLAFYNGKFLDSTQYDFDNCSMKDIGQCLLAPTYSQAFRWFREKYKLVVDWNHFEHNNFGIYIGVCIKNVYLEETIVGVYKEHEEAELACLKHLIKLVKKVTNE